MLVVRMNPLPRRAFLGLVLDGVRVEDDVAGSTAEAAGLRGDDVLQAIDGKRLTDHALDDVLRSIGSKEHVAIAIERAGEDVTFDVAVVPRPAEILEGHE